MFQTFAFLKIMRLPRVFFSFKIYILITALTRTHNKYTYTQSDFGFFNKDMAMLNHASFGAVPLQVQKVQREYQDRWLRHADSWYFGGKLEEGLLDAARDVGKHIGAKEEETCLLGNATDATITILHRWNRKYQESSSSSRSSVISLNFAYRANKIALGYYIQPYADVIYTDVPFPYRSFDSSFFPTVLENLERDLRKNRPRFALLEHIFSQPAIRLPIEDMVKLCREYGVEEIAVDGAHGVGSIPDLDVSSIGAEFYYSNLHKWGIIRSSSSFSLSLSLTLSQTTQQQQQQQQVSVLTPQLCCTHVRT